MFVCAETRGETDCENKRERERERERERDYFPLWIVYQYHKDAQAAAINLAWAVPAAIKQKQKKYSINIMEK